MDIANLEGLISTYFRSGLAPSTQSTYLSAKRRYWSFCLQHDLSPFPVTQHQTCLFAAFLASSGLQASSISSYLSALRHLQVEAGQVPPARCEWPHLQYVLRGIKRTHTPSGRLRLPITIDIMFRIHGALFSRSSSLSYYGKVMVWAACCMGFFGFMRSGEFTACKANQGKPVQLKDVAVDSHSSPSLVRIFLEKAKTDPFGKGVHVYLGKTGSQVCPVSAVLQFIAVRPPGQGPLFVCQENSPLSQQQFVQIVKDTLLKSGVDPAHYSGHSFRIGAATSAAKAGLPAYLIKTLGRWESEAYLLYVRTPRITLAQVASQLVALHK